MSGENKNAAYHRPIIIPELLKELVHRQIETSELLKTSKISEKSKLAQRCYLSSLKLVKSHIVSGLREPEYENPLEYAQELLISSGNSTKIHKLNKLYDKLSNLSLSVPELSYVKVNNNGVRNRDEVIRSNKFESKILRLLIPLYGTGVGKGDGQAVFQDLEALKNENVSGLCNVDDNKYVENVEYRISNYRRHSESRTALTENRNNGYGIFEGFRERKEDCETRDTFKGRIVDDEGDRGVESKNSDAVGGRIPESVILRSRGEHYDSGNLSLVNFEPSGDRRDVKACGSEENFSLPLYVLEKILLSPTQELALVNDILYVLQGFDGQFIKYDLSTDQYTLLPSVYSPKSTRVIVTEICELGVMHRRMSLVLKKVDSQLAAPHFRERSTLTKVLVEFSRDLLEENLNFVSGLQNDVQETISRLSRLDAGKNPNKELLASDRPLLTLRRLLQIVNDQKNKKKKIFAILEGLYGLNNASVLSGLYLQLSNVNNTQRAVLNELFQRCLTVWLRELNMVIREGKRSRTGLPSSNSKQEEQTSNFDFFICESLDNKQGGRRLFYVQHSLVPVFLSGESANIVLKICETRAVLKELNSKEGDCESTTREITSDVLINSNKSVLNATLREIQESCNSQLVDILIKRDSLLFNLSILRDLFLCLKGDFWELSSNCLSKELSKPANKVSVQNLQDLFQNSLRSHFNRSDGGPDLSEFVSVCLLDCDSIPPDSTGWEAFSLKLEFPTKSISFVLTSLDLIRYQRLFGFIWKINAVNYRLNEIWIRIVKYLRGGEISSVFEFKSNGAVHRETDDAEFSVLKTIPRKLVILRYTSCLIRNIILSINSIRGIAVFDSINSLWERLSSSIGTRAHSLDDIQFFHGNYLSGVEFGLFVSPSLCSRSSSTNDTQMPKLTQDLHLCLDLLLETGLYMCKVSSTMLTNINMSEYHPNQSADGDEERLYAFYEEMELCSKNYRNCISSISKNLSMIISEIQDVAPFSSECDKLGATQLQLDLFKLLVCEFKHNSSNCC
ncbi:gamma tubulin complex protein 3 [Cryptosporidium ryanae]|uniref:gamma tubulin complex protein 3 n=1 Tax=Cryptosporidium ryanae TaxID=515981 RepID=UPI003519F1B9|nr:gamma tubulin complex protein 3 [Cryptosporidium ryanae]